MEVCYKLWEFMDPGAVVADEASGITRILPRSMRSTIRVNTIGAVEGISAHHLRKSGPLCGKRVRHPEGETLRPSMQKRFSPCIRTCSECVSIFDDLNERMFTKFNRPEGSVKLIFGVQPIVGTSRAEAVEKQDAIRALVPQQGL